MLQPDAIPIIGVAKSSVLKPTPGSMARLGARSGPSSTLAEKDRVDFRSGLARVELAILEFSFCLV